MLFFHLYIHIYMKLNMCIYTYIDKYTHISANMHITIHIYICIYTYDRICTCSETYFDQNIIPQSSFSLLRFIFSYFPSKFPQPPAIVFKSVHVATEFLEQRVKFSLGTLHDRCMVGTIPQPLSISSNQFCIRQIRLTYQLA